MNSSFSLALLVVPIALAVVVWAVFGRLVGSIAVGLALAMLVFNSSRRRPE
jgi:hypothetical protein